MNKLKQIRMIDSIIDSKISDMGKMYDMTMKINKPLNPDKVQTSGSGDMICDLVSKIVDLQVEINADIDRLVDIKAEVYEQLKEIGNPLAVNVLTKKYFEGKTIIRVAEECDISRQWVSKLIGRYYHQFDE